MGGLSWPHQRVAEKTQAQKCEAVKYEAVKCEAVKWQAKQFKAVQCEATKCKAVKCKAVKCKAVKCKAVKKNNAFFQRKFAQNDFINSDKNSRAMTVKINRPLNLPRNRLFHWKTYWQTLALQIIKNGRTPMSILFIGSYMGRILPFTSHYRVM
ncbi:conserved Plasmodium protein, unknown function [Plasmodium ovale curtisi]|uniref:Uncharacterized protein n=1 Tax=Plasmodium ovale curtisi TaxID=864141 RepID=A0A1A8W511_PLAOA|nr:conserved Plasmodium protein, unknown function [Plasmodium ovale curtisi]